MQKAFDTIKQLVADFTAQESAYLSPSYQESQIRQDFIDKFFTALGWDVTHTIQKNPYQQEVHIENKVHMAGSQRRADYAFFLAPNFRDPKFFVEAKKPSRNLANADDYYQTIRYGWNANTPIAILTDFEEFHILDCRFKPSIKNVMIHKIEYFHYSDYANEEKFSRLYWLFSREAVASGSLEKRVTELPKLKGKAVKGGYQPVDEAFLEELDKYREILAKAFKKSNPDLQSEELTESIQRIIDRLVFIRFLEDKQIEEPEIIQLASKKSAWKGFLELCKQLDPKYNGLVFKPHKVLDGKEFVPPDDEEFGAICRELSDPHSPYNFDQIPISILGSIYERFLGKVVHATDKRVKVAEKPEVRKAGGVYYTPEYIVRYIVNETVGKLLFNNDTQSLRRSDAPKGQVTEAIRQTKEEEIASPDFIGIAMTKTEGETVRNDEFGKTPEQVAQMAFADIACGSGSFLIEVYGQLLDYHIRYYIAHPAKQKEADVFERDGKLKLTLKKKKEILLNNIYGVDIDFQATEVTQLSLFLKMLEDVTMQDAHQFGMFKETILPDLRNNIINGNSLIGTDIYDGDLFAPALSSQSFSRKRESYAGQSKIPADAGMTGEKDEGIDKLKPMNFEDAFPVVMKRGGFDAVVGNPPYVLGRETFNDNWKDYIASHYKSYGGKYDLYVFFTEKAIVLLKDRGKFGYILPNTVLANVNATLLRKSIIDKCSIDIIRIFSKRVFEGAQVESAILVLSSNNSKASRENNVVKIEKDNTITVMQSTMGLSDDYKFNINLDESVSKLLLKIRSVSLNLGNISDICIGIQLGGSSGKETKHGFLSTSKKENNHKKVLDGKDINRYKKAWPGVYVRYGNWLHRKRDEKYFLNPKIVVRQIGATPVATFDDEEYYTLNTIYNLLINKPFGCQYVLGIMNSSIGRWVWTKENSDFKSLFPKIKKEQLEGVPIRTINFDDPQDKSRHNAIVKLVEQMLEAKGKLSNVKTEAETNRLEMQCQTLDRQIDERVYELYGLTEEEIKIVEGKS